MTWSDAPGAHLDSEQALEEFAAIGRDKSREGVPYEKVGDAKAAMASAKRVFRGEYRTRYVYHAQMEPMNATAAVSADGKSAEIWAGTQAATSLLKGVAHPRDRSHRTSRCTSISSAAALAGAASTKRYSTPCGSPRRSASR